MPTQLVVYPDASHVFILLGQPVAAARLQPPGARLARAAHHRRRPAARSTSPTGSSGWPGWPSGTACPGAQLGILRIGVGRRCRRAGRDGVRRAPRRHPGSPPPPTRVFQIGSITKVWTATVAMQLVDEGLLDPRHARSSRCCPSCALARPRRHQAGHRCGTCSPTPAASTATCSPTPAAATTAWRSTSTCSARPAQNHPLGATWSYCNSGFALLGRVIEKVTGQTWDQAMRERLFTPLGLDPHRARCRRRRCCFARRRRATTSATASPPGPGLGPAPLDRAGRADHLDGRRRARLRPDAPHRRARPRTAPAC